MTRLMDRPDTQAIAQARERYARRIRRRRALLGCLITVALIAAVVLAAGLTVAKPLWITEGGMSPTLEAGTLVLYNGLHTVPARGDVVVSTVESPAGGMLVRRVIGLPGDRVRVDRNTGAVTVNGEPLRESYVSCLGVGNMDIEDETLVPEGEVFVLGDERLSALDSRQRSIGTLPVETLLGKVWLRLWPLEYAGMVE